MQRLPLYPDGIPAVTIESTTPTARDPGCTRCPFHKDTAAGSRCLGPSGKPGGILIVGSALSAGDAKGKALYSLSSGPLGAFVRGTVSTYAPKGVPIAYDVASRCTVPEALLKGELSALRTSIIESAAACAPYLARVLADQAPTRIIALGYGAARALVGHDLPPLDTLHRGYVHTSKGVPVFILPDPVDVVGNRFMRQQWVDDLAWALRADPMQPPVNGAALLVRTPVDARVAVAALYRAGWMAWDIESTGRFYDHGYRVVSVACTPAGSDDAYVWDESALADPAVRGPLLELLADPDFEKVAMNGKTDGLGVRCTWGVVVQGTGRDIGLRCSLLNPESTTRLAHQQWLVGMAGGKRLMDEALERAVLRVKQLAQAGIDGQGALFGGGTDSLPRGTNYEHALANPYSYAYALVDRPLLSRYNALDTVSTARLEAMYERIYAEPENDSLLYIWNELVRHISPAVEQMVAWGVKVNVPAIHALRAYVAVEQKKVALRLAKHGLHEPGSNPKVAELLFDKLKLKPKEGMGRGTSEAAIEHLRGRHPAVDDVLAWRGWDKLRGTYCEGLLRQITADDRIHPDVREDGARSGRMSIGGGLHGLPRPESPEGKMVRDCIGADADHVLYEVDLAQAEVRGAAGLTGDKVMADAIASGDIHQRTAESLARRVWGIDPSQVEPKHRSAAKIIVLSLIYGKGDKALAEEITDKTKVYCSPTEVAEIRAGIMGTFSTMAAGMKRWLREAEAQGYAYTYFRGRKARRRPLLALGYAADDKSRRAERGNHERAAGNTPVQGTTADVVQAALIEVVAWLIAHPEVRARLVLTVHDSLVLEVHVDDLERVRRVVKAILERHRIGDVPLVADEKVGRSYGSLKKPANLVAA